MAAPTVLYVEASDVASSVQPTVPSVTSGTGAAVGDLCVIVQQTASPTNGPASHAPYISGGTTDAGFTAAGSGVANTLAIAGWYKVLVSGDFSGSNLANKWDAVLTSAGTQRTTIYFVHHASGWDSATCLVENIIQTATNPGGNTVASPTNEAVAQFIIGHYLNGGTNISTQTWNWDGAGLTDPYFDESSQTHTTGGHGLSRTDSTGVTINNGSTSHSDTHIVAGDLYSLLSGAAFVGGQYITAVTPGVGFTSSANATSGTSSVTLSPPHYGYNNNFFSGDFREYDSSDTPSSIVFGGSATGLGVTHRFHEYNFQVKVVTDTGTGSFSGAGTFTASGTPTVLGTAPFSGSGTFTATGVKTVFGTAAFAGGGTFLASQQGTSVVNGTATFTGNGTFSGLQAQIGTSSFSGGGSFSSGATVTHLGAPTFAGGGTFAAAEFTGIRQTATGGSWSSSSLAIVGDQTITGTAAFAGSGTFAATGHKVNALTGNPQFVVAAQFTAVGTKTVLGTCTFLGLGAFHATQQLIPASEPLVLNTKARLVLDTRNRLVLKG